MRDVLMNDTNKYLAIILCVVLCCVTYIYVNKTQIVATETSAYTYNNITGEVSLHTVRGTKVVSNKQKNDQKNPKNSIILETQYTVSGGCTKEFPVAVYIQNISADTMLELKFKLDVRKKGNSSSLIKNPLPRERKFSDIIVSGDVHVMCYRMPELTEKFDSNTMEVHAYDLKYTFLDYLGGNQSTKDRFIQ